MFTIYANDLDISTIREVINEYESNEARLIRKRFNYYNGKQAILEKQVADGRPCNKVVQNYFRTICDTFVGYLDAQHSTYSTVGIEDNIEVLTDVIRDSVISGVGYVLAYLENGEKKLVKLRPTTTCLIRTPSFSHDPIGAITWNRYEVIENGYKRQYLEGYAYDAYKQYYFKGYDSLDISIESESPHYIGCLPIVEFKSSKHYEGVADQSFSIQDALNTVTSSYIDSRESISDSFLLIKGIQVDEESARSIINAESKILNLPLPDADAQYMTLQDSAGDVKTASDSLREKLFSLCCCPDLASKEAFMASSGLALRYKLIPFVNVIHSIQACIEECINPLANCFGESECEINWASYSSPDVDALIEHAEKLNKLGVDVKPLLESLPYNLDLEDTELQKEVVPEVTEEVIE